MITLGSGASEMSKRMFAALIKNREQDEHDMRRGDLFKEHEIKDVICSGSPEMPSNQGDLCEEVDLHCTQMQLEIPTSYDCGDADILSPNTEALVECVQSETKDSCANFTEIVTNCQTIHCYTDNPVTRDIFPVYEHPSNSTTYDSLNPTLADQYPQKASTLAYSHRTYHSDYGYREDHTLDENRVNVTLINILGYVEDQLKDPPLRVIISCVCLATLILTVLAILYFKVRRKVRLRHGCSSQYGVLESSL